MAIAAATDSLALVYITLLTTVMRHPAYVWSLYQLRRFGRIFGYPQTFSALPPPVFETRARTLPCRPALFNADHLSRVTHCAFDQNVSALAEVLQANHYTERPLATYPLGHATIIGGIIFGRDDPLYFSEVLSGKWADTIGQVPSHDTTVVTNSMQGLRFFGHWLSDDVSVFEAFRDNGDLISLPLPNWNDVSTYSQLFEQDWQQARVIRTRALTLVRDLGFSERKAERYRRLRDRLRQHIAPSEGRNKVVFLRRGPSGAPREIANSDELEKRLSEAGVIIVTAEGDTRAFIESILDASIIITIEGSQDRHAIYALREKGAVLTLLPPDRFYVATHEWARNLDMHSGAVIGKIADNGFYIEPDEVLVMVDQLLTLIERKVEV